MVGPALTTLTGGTIDPADPGGAAISLAEFAVTAVELRRVIAKARVADDRDLRTAATAREPAVDRRPGVRAAARDPGDPDPATRDQRRSPGAGAVGRAGY